MVVIPLQVSAGTPFSYQVSASGNPELIFAENLPNGWVCSSSGLITGTVPSTRRFVVTVLAKNKSGVSAAVLDITTTVPPPPVMGGADTALAEVGVAFSYQIVATSALAITSYSASNLPSWLSLNSSTGLLTGTANITETRTLLVGATNANGTATKNVILNSAVRPIITSSLAFSCLKNSQSSYQIVASANPVSYTASGLPAGLTLNTSSGLISGTPTVSGSFNVTLTASNVFTSNPVTLVLSVNEVPQITSALTATVTYNVAFSYQITTSGSPSPSSYGATNLPSGLSINTSTGLISGTLNMSYPGPINVLLSATNTTGTGTAELVLTIVNERANVTQDTIMKPWVGTSPYSTQNNWVVMGRKKIHVSTDNGVTWSSQSASQANMGTVFQNSAGQEDLNSRIGNLVRNPVDPNRKNLVGNFVVSNGGIYPFPDTTVRYSEYWGQFLNLVDRFRFNYSLIPGGSNRTLSPDDYYLIPAIYKNVSFPNQNQSVYYSDGGMLLGGTFQLAYLVDGYGNTNGDYQSAGVNFPFFGSIKNSIYLRNKTTPGVSTMPQSWSDAGGGAAPYDSKLYNNCTIAASYIDVPYTNSDSSPTILKRGLLVKAPLNPNSIAKSTYIVSSTELDIGSNNHRTRLFLSKNPLATNPSTILQFYYPSTSLMLPSKPASGGPNGVVGAYSAVIISLVRSNLLYLNPVGVNIDGGRGYDQIAQNEDGDIIVVAGGAYGSTKSPGENTMAYSTDFGSTWTVMDASPSSAQNSTNLYYFKPTGKFYVTYGTDVYSSTDAVSWSLDTHPGTDAPGFPPRQFAKDLDKEPFYDVPNDPTLPRNTKHFVQVKYLGVENCYPFQVAISDENRTNWVVSTFNS